jgi:pSer/pThr/pTyr-binding forkhead associated (FHA) protein
MQLPKPAEQVRSQSAVTRAIAQPPGPNASAIAIHDAQRIEIRLTGLTIGRHPDNDLVVSSELAFQATCGDRLGSRTLVRGRPRVEERHPSERRATGRRVSLAAVRRCDLGPVREGGGRER